MLFRYIYTLTLLVSAEQVTSIDLFLYVVQAAVITVGNDGLAAFFEFIKVIHDFTAKECTAILQSRLVDDDHCTLTSSLKKHCNDWKYRVRKDAYYNRTWNEILPARVQ